MWTACGAGIGAWQQTTAVPMLAVLTRITGFSSATLTETRTAVSCLLRCRNRSSLSTCTGGTRKRHAVHTAIYLGSLACIFTGTEATHFCRVFPLPRLKHLALILLDFVFFCMMAWHRCSVQASPLQIVLRLGISPLYPLPWTPFFQSLTFPFFNHSHPAFFFNHSLFSNRFYVNFEVSSFKFEVVCVCVCAWEKGEGRGSVLSLLFLFLLLLLVLFWR